MDEIPTRDERRILIANERRKKRIVKKCRNPICKLQFEVSNDLISDYCTHCRTHPETIVTDERVCINSECKKVFKLDTAEAQRSAYCKKCRPNGDFEKGINFCMSDECGNRVDPKYSNQDYCWVCLKKQKPQHYLDEESMEWMS